MTVATPHCQEAHLIENTGIGQNQHMFWDSKQACDQWFLKHANDGIQITDYSRIYGEPQARNKWNVGSIVVAAPLDDTLSCDYISYLNSDASRWFHAAITGREFVSPNATRLHFTIDYYATYFDTIEFKQCFVQRITGEEPAYTNLLPEPFSVSIIETPHNDTATTTTGSKDLDAVNEQLQQLNFLVVSDMEQTGEINKPQMTMIAGYPFGGYVHNFSDGSGVDNFVKGVVARQQNLLAKTTATASTVRAIIYAPTIANTPSGVQAMPANIQCPAAGKWNKTKNYQYTKIKSGTGETLTLDPKVFGKSSIMCAAMFTGGITGCCRLQIAEDGNCNAFGISTPTWAQISYAGTGADGQTIPPNMNQLGQTSDILLNQLLNFIPIM